MRRIWVTRASPGAEATARRLAAMGVEAVVAPLLEARPLQAEIDLTGVGALAFTSANGVRAFAEICPNRGIETFAVGAATAEAARAAGFTRVSSAEGDVEALARLIGAEGGRISGTVLHPSAARPAGDLAGALRRSGMAARRVAIYDTLAVGFDAARLDDLCRCDGVLIHSPRAGEALAERLAGRAVPGLTAYCLSPAVAATLGGLELGAVRTAALPNDDALLSLVAETMPNKAT